MMRHNFFCELTEVASFYSVVAPADDPDDRPSRHPGAVHHYGHVGVIVSGVGNVISKLGLHLGSFGLGNANVIQKSQSKSKMGFLRRDNSSVCEDQELHYWGGAQLSFRFIQCRWRGTRSCMLCCVFHHGCAWIGPGDESNQLFRCAAWHAKGENRAQGRRVFLIHIALWISSVSGKFARVCMVRVLTLWLLVCWGCLRIRITRTDDLYSLMRT